jgi:hypothetical protein
MNNNAVDFGRSGNTWEKEFEVMKTTSKITSSSSNKRSEDNWSNTFEEVRGNER